MRRGVGAPAELDTRRNAAKQREQERQDDSPPSRKKSSGRKHSAGSEVARKIARLHAEGISVTVLMQRFRMTAPTVRAAIRRAATES